jgi:hypothetical protein
MAKALGVDIVAFFDSEWPEGWYVDDSVLSCSEGGIFSDDNDSVSLPLSDKYNLEEFGYLCSGTGEAGISLTTFFNRWKKEKTTDTMIVEVPKKDRDDAIKLFESNGYKVVK